LTDAGIHGAVESDFFDWILQDAEGADLVLRIARQAARFRLRDVTVDVLKALYESLIDPTQRHDLGEYYTPDWLAAKVVRRAVSEPLVQRVLDPACGSGTFLFHAIRRLMAAATEAGWGPAQILEACSDRIRGLDVHPVAVIIARVTWLLALGDLVRQRRQDLNVPVFLGDALQWNVRDLTGGTYVEVPVPDESPLRIPGGFAEDQARYEPGLRALTDGLEDEATPADVRRRLLRLPGVTGPDADEMAVAFGRLQTLYRAGRNHIWPFVLRNLNRPLWLSRAEQRADVLVGNPPWVAYRHLSAEMQTNLREACQAMNLWVGGHLTTQQDLCALFWARCAERYLKLGGTIAFVLPYAALNRPAFKGLRRGDFKSAAVHIVEAWSFDETVQPLFPVPASVMIAKREVGGALPAAVTRYTGNLPRRDASETEADRTLRCSEAAWPPIPTLEGASPYRARFKQGATIVPRRFFFVERDAETRLGSNPNAPLLRGRVGKLDKAPWSTVEPPHGPVEIEFIRTVLLGESIAPFRILSTPNCVVPVHGREVLDSRAANEAGFRRLAAWMRDIEGKWENHAVKDAHGEPRMTLLQQIDYMHKLSKQLVSSPTRVVYAKAGTLLAACIVADATALVDHMAYWAPARTMEEARYLSAILNSETVRVLIAPMQPKGQGGARHFDNLVWELPIPEYRRMNTLHRELEAAAATAEAVASKVALTETAHFTRQRRAIRDALIGDGVAGTIDILVARLLAAD
jgi:N-6 DNA Methylase